MVFEEPVKKTGSTRVRFTIKTPRHKGRATFAIDRDVVLLDGRRRHTKVDDERILAVNKAYHSGKSFEECLVVMREIQRDLYDQERKLTPAVVHNQENYNIVDKYFKERYQRRRNVRENSKVSMYHDLVRAVEAVGSLSLYSASADQLQDAISTKYRGNAQRRVVMRLRQLLKHINRHDVRLELDFADDRPVRYLSMEEVDKVIAYFRKKEDPIMACLVALGAKCSMRLGEAYALETRNIKDNDRIYIDVQLLLNGDRRLPKHNKKRDAFVIGDGMYNINEWLRIPREVRDAYRRGNSRIPAAMKEACRHLFPGEPIKHLNFHDTRHCYGVHLVSIGLPTKSMGNSPDVCIRHYQGFMLSDMAMVTFRSLLKKA